MKLRIFLMLIAVLAVGAGYVAVSRAHSTTTEQLYLAAEVLEDGQRIGSPKMLGFEGKTVVAERRAPGAATADYRLVLKPTMGVLGYDVVLELLLPSGKKLGEVALLHGEERSVKLGEGTELKLLLLRVDSPEFRALMQNSADKARGTI